MIQDYFKNCAIGWNRFWFAPTDAAILALIRIATGLILFYSHWVWGLELATFFSNEGALPANYRDLLFENHHWVWSHFDFVSSPAIVWTIHWIGLGVIMMFALGLCTRVTAPLSLLLAISYANRAAGAQFGLDQIICFLCLYLALGNCGARFSLDQYFFSKQNGRAGGWLSHSSATSPWNTIALRLIQLHMCLVYLFAGLGKLQGSTWWDGTAIWYSLSSYEYQTFDLTWLAEHLWFVNLVTLVAVAWEITYPFLIWNRLARPIYLLIAIAVHLGIGLAMGMLTFGFIMLAGNLAFLPNEWLKATRRRLLPESGQ